MKAALRALASAPQPTLPAHFACSRLASQHLQSLRVHQLKEQSRLLEEEKERARRIEEEARKRAQEVGTAPAICVGCWLFAAVVGCF